MFKSWFAPSPRYRLQLAHQFVNISAGQTILHSALLHGVNIPHGCKTGACGMCKCRLLSGQVELVIEPTAKLTATEIDSGVFFACCAVAKTDLRVDIGVNAVTLTKFREHSAARL